MTTITPTVKIKQPRPHQLQAILNGQLHFRSFDSGKMIQPCGAGKTLTSLWLAAEVGAKKIVVVLPTLQLQSQALKAWIEDITSANLNFESFIVGSDKTIGQEYRIQASTNETDILAWFNQVNERPFIIFTTYHSSDTLASIMALYDINIDLCIFDEAHRTAGPEKQNFQALIKYPGLRISKRLFMTATPKVLQAHGKGGDMQFYSMDDESIYGKEFYRLSTRKAIEEGIISNYKIVTMYTDDSSIEEYIKKNLILNDKTIKDLKADSRLISIAVSVLKAIQKFKLHHIIAFTSTIERSKSFNRILQLISSQMGIDVGIFHIDNTMLERERASLLTKFAKSKCAVISNARLLGEGFDLPSVDATVFVDERSSSIDIVQAAGRAWRIAKNKQYGYILLPCLLNRQKSVGSEDFIILRRVLSALSTTDELVYDLFSDTYRNNDYSAIIRSDIFHSDLTASTAFNLNSFIAKLQLSVWKNVQGIKGNFLNLVPWFEAAKFTKSLEKYGIINYNRWRKFCKKPEFFPGAPTRPTNIPIDLKMAYGNHYQNLLFFSKSTEYHKPCNWEEAAKFTLSLSKFGIHSRKHWELYCKNPSAFPGAPAKPDNIPISLWQTYKSVYKSSLFFTAPIIAKEGFVTEREAAQFVRSLHRFGITSYKKWKDYYKNPSGFLGAPSKPLNIPKDLRKHYKNANTTLFFTKIFEKKEWVSLKEAAIFTKSLGEFGVINYKRWKDYCSNPSRFPGAPKRPANIPAMLHRIYKEKYQSEAFFVSPGTKRSVNWKEASKFTRSLSKYGVTNNNRWKRYCRNNALFENAPTRPIDIPIDLKKAYKQNFIHDVFFTD